MFEVYNGNPAFVSAPTLKRWNEAMKVGGKVQAIPHNANLSNGRMFESTRFDGSPQDADYAKRRTRWEVLQEVMQTKGNSETHPSLSPNDEFANYGIAGWEYGNLTLEGEPESPAMRPYMYLRAGQCQGPQLPGQCPQSPNERQPRPYPGHQNGKLGPAVPRTG
jgi:hypothetical protein